MSILAGAIGAGIVLAAIGHEAALKREADKINTERLLGEEEAALSERIARETNLREMRNVTEAQLQNRMMRAGMVPTVRGRAARAVYLRELARQNEGY